MESYFSRFIISWCVFGLGEDGVGVLSCKSALVDQVWLEKAVSFK